MRIALISLLTLAACAEEGDPSTLTGSLAQGEDGALAMEQAPPPTGPVFASDALIAGSPAAFQVTGAPANTNVFFGRGPAGLSCPPSLGGNCLDINPPVLLGSATSNANGTATLRRNIPGALPAGLSAFMQGATTVPAPSVSTLLDQEVESAATCPPGTRNLLRDSGFEVGMSDAWYGNFGSVGVTNQSLAGARAAEVVGNIGVCWNVVDTATADLLVATYATYHVEPGGVQAVEWFYSNGGFDSFFTSNAQGVWETFDILSSMDPGVELASICFYGWTGGTTRFDQLQLCAR
jgi:hypothetical protein